MAEDQQTYYLTIYYSLMPKASLQITDVRTTESPTRSCKGLKVIVHLDSEQETQDSLVQSSPGLSMHSLLPYPLQSLLVPYSPKTPLLSTYCMLDVLALNVHTYCTVCWMSLHLNIVLGSMVWQLILAISAVYTERVNLAIVSVWHRVHMVTTIPVLRAMYFCFSFFLC